MSSKVASLPVAARPTAAQPFPKTVVPAPIELDAALLKHVSGGASASRVPVVVNAPKGTW